MVTVAEDRYLTVDDVAERLHVSAWSVREWLKSGRLVGFQPGGRRVGWRIRESELERFVADREGRQGKEV